MRAPVRTETPRRLPRDPKHGLAARRERRDGENHGLALDAVLCPRRGTPTANHAIESPSMMSRRGQLVLRVLALIACSTICVPASAEPSEAERGLAQALFDEARQLMGQEQYAAACAKLAQSQRLAPGGGTLLNLALCHEELGRTATAWSEYNLALSQAIKDGRKDRQDIAHERIDALAASLAHVSIDVDAGAADDINVTIDDEPLAREAWRTEVPADPGDHRVEARATGRKSWHQTIHVEASRTLRVAIPALEVAEPTHEDPSHEGASAAPRESPPAPSNGRRTAGYVVLGAGLASVGLGAGFGVATLSNGDEANRLCPGNAPCASSAGLDASDRAHAFAWGADIAIGAGIVAVAVGAYLLLTSPAPARPAASPVVSPFPGPFAFF